MNDNPQQNKALAELLKTGIQSLNLNLDNAAQEKLLIYLHKLIQWNQAYNLTAIRDPAEMITKHLLDSLSIVPHMLGESILDVGTGAGLPGIPLAISYPDKHFVLLDSNGKKTRFLTQILHDLELKNISVINERVEKFRPANLFDAIVSRAFASVEDFIKTTQHLLKPTGYFFAMKGKYPYEELENLSKEVALYQTYRLNVPGLDAERHLLIFQLIAL